MKIILLALLCVLPAQLFAQIELKDSVHHTEMTVYAGTLAGPRVLLENAKISGIYTLRVGATINYAPAKWISIFALGAGEVAQIDTSTIITPFTLFAVKVRPIKALTITVGKIASPMTELRPIPTTGAGQFEPWTKARIPGSALGGKASFSLNKDFSLTGGIFARGFESSSELSVGNSHIRVAGYYMNQTKMHGGALQVTYPYVSNTIMYNHNQNCGMVSIITIPKTKGVAVYSDIGFNPNNWSMIRGEWGLFKAFSINTIFGLVGAGYNNEMQSLNGYVFIHI